MEPQSFKFFFSLIHMNTEDLPCFLNGWVILHFMNVPQFSVLLVCVLFPLFTITNMLPPNLFCKTFLMNWWEYFFLKDESLEVGTWGHRVWNFQMTVVAVLYHSGGTWMTVHIGVHVFLQPQHRILSIIIIFFLWQAEDNPILFAWTMFGLQLR